MRTQRAASHLCQEGSSDGCVRRRQRPFLSYRKEEHHHQLSARPYEIYRKESRNEMSNIQNNKRKNRPGEEHNCDSSDQVTPDQYLKYPVEKQRDAQVAFAALMSIDETTESYILYEVVAKVYRHCPNLLQDEDLLRTLLMDGQDRVGHTAISNYYMKHNIAWNKELAVLACRQHPCNYFALPPECRKDNDVALQALATDVDRFLVCFAPNELFRRKEFMVKAMAIDPRIFERCDGKLMGDFDILYAAAGCDNAEFLSLMESYIRKQTKVNHQYALVPFAKEFKVNKLGIHLSFQTFLSCITVAGRERNRPSSVGLLQCGELKRLVGQFLGAPTTQVEMSMVDRAWTKIGCYSK